MMTELLILIPVIYYFWSGVLIAWASLCSVGIFRVIEKLYELHGRVRKTDYVYLIGSIIIAITLSTILFITPEFAANIIDLLLGINLWFSVFLALGCHSSLSLLPVLETTKNAKTFRVLSNPRH